RFGPRWACNTHSEARRQRNKPYDPPDPRRWQIPPDVTGGEGSNSAPPFVTMPQPLVWAILPEEEFGAARTSRRPYLQPVASCRMRKMFRRAPLCRAPVSRAIRPEPLERRVLMAAGYLDPSFDGDGRLALPGGTANAVAVQADGKVVTAGGSEDVGGDLR